MSGHADLTVITFRNMLGALRLQLGKASSHAAQAGVDPESLLEARLAEDMLPLASQIQFSCGLARECLARLTGNEVPVESPVTSLAQAIRRIDDIVAALDIGSGHPANLDEDREIELALPVGLTFRLGAADYIRDWALPQFYFHVLMAYAILRNAGVPLGKADFVPHMSKYLRS